MPREQHCACCCHPSPIPSPSAPTPQGCFNRLEALGLMQISSSSQGTGRVASSAKISTAAPLIFVQRASRETSPPLVERAPQGARAMQGSASACCPSTWSSYAGEGDKYRGAVLGGGIRRVLNPAAGVSRMQEPVLLGNPATDNWLWDFSGIRSLESLPESSCAAVSGGQTCHTGTLC